MSSSSRQAPDQSRLARQDRAERLRAAGLRATTPRLEILEAIETDRRHPTAEMIYESLQERHPSLSLSTVYATMETFARSGLVRRIASAQGRLRIDGTAQDHDHAVCRVCGDVFDIDLKLIERPIAPEQLPFGLKLQSLYVEYEVICPGCSAAEEPDAAPAPSRFGEETPAREAVSGRARSRRATQSK